MAQQPAESAEPGTVIEVYQRGYRLNGQSCARRAWSSRLGARDGAHRTTTRRSAWTGRPPRTRSRRPTASSPASTTRTRNKDARRPRSASRRSPRPTTSSATPRSARSTTAAAPCSPAAARSAAAAPAPGLDFGSFSDILSNIFSAGGGAARRHAHAGRRAEHGRDLETDGQPLLRAGDRGRPGPGRRRHARRVPDLPRHRREPGTNRSSARVCHGRGVESQGQGLFSITRPCTRCGGSGTVIEQPCPTCGGEGAAREVKKYRVNIPPGVKEGSRIRLAGKGEAGARGGPPGDLYVVTHVSESPVFKPQGRPPRGRGAAHGPRGPARRRDRGPDAERHARRCGSRRAPSTAPSSACAARARRSSAARAAATSTTAS